MTDNEIIKALEAEIRISEYVNSDYSDVELKVLKSALDLINRQNAEIERLKEENESLKYCYNHACDYNNKLAKYCERDCKKFNGITKSEGIKEFAERLCNGRVSNDPVVIAVKVELEEMTEVTENEV